MLPKAKITADGEVERLERLLKVVTVGAAEARIDFDEEVKLRQSAEGRITYLEGRVHIWKLVAALGYLTLFGHLLDLLWAHRL